MFRVMLHSEKMAYSTKRGNCLHCARNIIVQNPVTKKKYIYNRKKCMQNGRRYSENVQATKG